MTRTSRACLLTPCLLAALSGCANFQADPERDISFTVNDKNGEPIPVWWVLRGQLCDRCDFGLVLGDFYTEPNTRTVENVRLVRMTPNENRIRWTGAYGYSIWYFLVFPVGGRWTGRSDFILIAPGQPDSWKFTHGREYPWLLFKAREAQDWQVEATNLGPSPDFADYYYPSGHSASRVANLVDDLRQARGVPRAELKEFLEAVLELPMSDFDRARVQNFLGELNSEE